jgi:DNA-directed RNA polymerase specialized sigma24 family protein
MSFSLDREIPGFVQISSYANPFSLQGVKAQAKANFKAIFEEHRHRIYSLAFWMTNSEIEAEEVSTGTFCTALKTKGEVTQVIVDSSFVAQLRDRMPIGRLTLDTQITAEKNVAGNTKRIHLEQAVVQVPYTERLAFLMHDVDGYSHAQIARTLGFTEEESKKAVFQARLLVRELVAKMV